MDLPMYVPHIEIVGLYSNTTKAQESTMARAT